MIRASILLILLAFPVSAEEVALPSGDTATLYDIIMESDPPLARFRFLTPQIGSGEDSQSFTQSLPDFDYLCNEVVLPALTVADWTGEDVVIIFSEQEVSWGETRPDIQQYFQPYRIADNTCTWVDF